VAGAEPGPGRRRRHGRLPAWAYPKAVWAIEETERDLTLICRVMGRKGLESIENVGPRLTEVVEGLIQEHSQPRSVFG
jgi:hypothetical protein